jgi:hypothetical protein
MKIIPIGTPQIVMQNPMSKHNYFGWPSVAKLQNGKIAVVASGFRRRHVCPFGKAVISYSEDEGKTYTAPAPVIDTVLDDRDSGVVPFGKSGVIVTSFNNTVEFQRRSPRAYDNAYLDTITPEEEAAALGSTFRISNDFGVTFGPLYKCPVTSPHGPLELDDGTILWIGRTFSENNKHRVGEDGILAYRILPDGNTEYVGRIPNIEAEGIEPLLCEPHSIQLPDGRILTHIRVQSSGKDPLFTTYQSESADGGKTWTTPIPLLERNGGAPAHLILHSSGLLISAYGYRNEPYGIRAMFSRDGGKTWDTGYEIWPHGISSDLGYPATIELSDGSLLTVFYAKTSENSPAVIMQQHWRFEE